MHIRGVVVLSTFRVYQIRSIAGLFRRKLAAVRGWRKRSSLRALPVRVWEKLAVRIYRVTTGVHLWGSTTGVSIDRAMFGLARIAPFFCESTRGDGC